VILAPGYLIARARGAVTTVALIAALAALAIFDVAALVGGTTIVWATWAATCLTVPMIPHAWLIFPDIAAAALAAWTVRWIAFPQPASHWRWAARAMSLSVLPWMHVKFAVLLVGLTLGLLWRLGPQRRIWPWIVVPVVLSSLAYSAFFYVVYGTFDPRAPWGGASNPTITVANVPRGVLGLLFDQKFGLLVHAPIYAVAAAGAVMLARRSTSNLQLAGFPVGILIAIAAAYTASCAQLYIWWGGESAPARLLVPIVPLVAPFIAACLGSQSVGIRSTVGLSLAVSLLISATSVTQLDRRLLFSDAHGVSQLVQLVQGPVPLISALPTFTEPDWPAPLSKLLPWLGAALASLGVAFFVGARRRATPFASAVAQGAAFLLTAGVLVGPFSRVARAEAVTRSRLALLDAFDPGSRAALNYAQLRRIAPAAWLRYAVIAFRRDVTPSIDHGGFIGAPMPLPPGWYKLTVWLEGSRPADGQLQMTLGHEQVVASTNGTLANPASLAFELPIQTPAIWIRLTDQTTARHVLRAEVEPLAVVSVAERPRVAVRSLESIPGHVGSFVVYVDGHTFPEHGGNFWTHGLERGRVMVKPSIGAHQLVLTLRTGPAGQTVHVTSGSEKRVVTLRPEQQESVTFDLPPGVTWFPIDVQASTAFRPVDVDPRSFDNRELGCLVRVELR
jgi:hypothetical protein